MTTEQITIMRVGVDALSKRVKLLPITKQTLCATDDLLFAKAWLGKVLGALGKETPYKNEGNRKTIEDIEPTADEAVEYTMNAGTTIEAIDNISQDIAVVIKDLESLSFNGARAEAYLSWSYKDLCKARFWLGFELERIRKDE